MKKNFLKITTGFALSLFMANALHASEPIIIGVQAPITGKYANEGQSIDNGVRLMAKWYNDNGGVLGRQIKVVSCDDEGIAQKAAICARKLVNEKVLAVIGSYTSGAAEAAQTTYYRNKILQTSDGTSDTLTKHKYWTFFRNSFQNSAQATFTADYLVNSQKFKKIALLSDYSSYSTGLTKAVSDAIKKINGNIIYEGKIKSGTQNFTAILTKIKSLNPDVIYYGGYYVDGGLLRAQQVQLDIDAKFVGGDSNDNPDFLKLAGKSAANTIMINFPTPDFLPYDIAKDFLSQYQKTYGMNVASIWTLMNVDGLRAILHAMSTIKSDDTKKISDFLHELKNYDGITGPISFNKDGERINAKFNVYEIQSDNSYKIIN